MTTREGDITYLGWIDPDKKRTAAQKLAAAVKRYAEKFAERPTLCLTNPQEAEEIGPYLGDVRVEGRGYIARNTFYVGRERGSDHHGEDQPGAAEARPRGGSGPLLEAATALVSKRPLPPPAAQGQRGRYVAAPLPGL